MQPTHINAYYADLAEAEKELAASQGKVDQLKETIATMNATPVVDAVSVEDVAEAPASTDISTPEVADVTPVASVDVVPVVEAVEPEEQVVAEDQAKVDADVVTAATDQAKLEADTATEDAEDAVTPAPAVQPLPAHRYRCRFHSRIHALHSENFFGPLAF